jgi:ubiquinone/menaquinone biosynthesis C-methylase UbiE
LTGSFLDRQRDFFDTADEGHFIWQTRNPYVARTERELLSGITAGSSHSVLEVGCGEGGNIVNVFGAEQSQPRVIGLDLFEQKVRFAKRAGVPALLVCADALRLPFADAAFDLVLCRDVLHHVANRDRVLSELRRVCRTGGTVWIVEPNGKNPLMRMLALTRPHERGLLENSVASLRRLISPHFPTARYDVKQPLPVHRLLLHYQFGIPRLGSSQAFGAVMDAWDRFACRIVPHSWWAYVLVRAEV